MTLVVPFPPGGSTDALARLLQSHLQTRLGRTVLVENKSGAAGSLGAIQVAKSAPDGATFLVTFDSHAVIPSILEKPGLDVEKDLLPVFLVGTAPYVIASMAKSVKEILSEPAVAAQLQETQQMTLLLADGKEFSTFFAKQVSIWGQVVRENNIKA